jgi:hypothetical protein
MDFMIRNERRKCKCRYIFLIAMILILVFSLASCSYESKYTVKNNRIYLVEYYEGYPKLQITEGADPATFTVLTDKHFHKGVGKDDNCYYIGIEQTTKEEVDKL